MRTSTMYRQVGSAGRLRRGMDESIQRSYVHLWDNIGTLCLPDDVCAAVCLLAWYVSEINSLV